MKVLYLVNMNENNKKGLFTATHERLKEIIKSESVDKYKIYSVQFYDGGIIKIIKKILNKEIRYKGKDNFTYEEIDYNKIYIKVGIIKKLLEKINLDFFNYLPILIKYKKDIKKFDLISVHWGYPHGRLGYWINKLYKKLYIVTYHGSDIHTMPIKNKHIAFKLMKVMNNAYKNIFVSNNLYLLATKLGYNKDNYIISKNGVNISDFYRIDDKEIYTLRQNIGIKNNVVGFVGNLDYVKRADKLVEIFKEIKNRKADTDFIIVGDGKLLSSIQKQAKDSNLNIYFTGKLEKNEVRDFLSVMDIMVLPSRNEGFGCVVLEANACGTKVIASDVGGISEAIGDKSLLVEEGEDFEKRFAIKVCEALKNNYDKTVLIDRVKENFSWAVISKDELNIYKNIKDKKN